MRCFTLFLVLALSSFAAPAQAQFGRPITEVVLEQEGRPVTDPVIVSLIETRVGAPLEASDVRETVGHIMSLNRFDDVQVSAEDAGSGLRVRYVLTPLHPVDRIEFEGTLGLPEDDVLRAVVDRFGNSPRAARTPEIVESLRMEYRRRGYANARISSRLVETHDPDRATLIFEIESGRRLVIADRRFTQRDADVQGTVTELPDIKPGQPFDDDVIERELRAWEDRMHSRGFYEARASHGSEITEDGAIVSVNLTRGPRVVVRFTGDQLPEADLERLVPIRTEGSADEDLLEDSSRAIEDFLHARGYRDANALFMSQEQKEELIITFDVDRGPRYLVRNVSFTGNMAVPEAELLALIPLKAGEPFVRTTVAGGLGAIERLYRTRGFTRAEIKAGESVIVPENAADPDRQTDVQVAIAEGPRTLIGMVSFAGNMAVSEPTLRILAMVSEGQAFSEAEMLAARERIDLEYRNRGYEGVVVTSEPTFAESDTRADVVFTISEGPQVVVDHIIIVGNRRISTRTIQREILLREGEPLSFSALLESRQRLAALGMFRRAEVEVLGKGGETRRDVLIEVEESPPTELGFGGGLEGGSFLTTGDTGLAEERFEVAPRGFFQIGRRNLWGKNRRVDLFTRLAVRPRDPPAVSITDPPPSPAPTLPEDPLEDLGGRFYEYRVLGQFREPRAFDTRADVVVTALVEQARRSSFNFDRREARVEAGVRLSPIYSAIGLYSFQRTRLFDERFTPDAPPPLIDRLFPEVRLSKVSASLIRDKRDDPLDPSTGTMMIVDGELAARAIGSEVGFVQTYLQGFYYHRLPAQRRVVLALGARVGLAHGFTRLVEGVTIQDLPASERFFAGGDTTVRGFTLDRLGNEDTITSTGFPTGGNSVVILNSELRIAVVGPLQATGFVDAGNVFLKASDLDFTDVRPTAGFGVMYRSPVGPIRVDLGFNLNPRELVPGMQERSRVLHILLGQPF
ncbi:MAG TPA: POTRA domain-containing protein [Vicinamibacterales bacterium]|nr:POTRA domain-containing protein [Vicinamibacterales bacterium]